MLPKRKIIEVFEELSPQDNGYWAVLMGSMRLSSRWSPEVLMEDIPMYIMPGVAVTEVVY